MSKNPPRIQWLFLNELVPSPFNPKREINEELVLSIQSQGVLQPVLVRPLDGGPDGIPAGQPLYEIVYGHRRWMAAKKAGLEKIPGEVRAMKDAEVLAVQLIENEDREDLHPLDLATNYHRLSVALSSNEEELARRVGRPLGQVRRLLALAGLDPVAGQILRERQATFTLLLAVARLPQHRHQAAVNAIVESLFGRESEENVPLDTDNALRVLHYKFHLSLKDAPFNPEDEQLVPEAGPCTTCPKRAGAAPALFAELTAKQSDDTCTDEVCYDRKRLAFCDQALVTARERGHETITPEQSEQAKLFRMAFGGWEPTEAYHQQFIRLDTMCREDPKGRRWRELIPARFRKGTATVKVAAPDGEIFESIPKRLRLELLRESGHGDLLNKAKGKDKPRKSDPRQAARIEREKLLNSTVVEAIAKVAVERASAQKQKKGTDSYELLKLLALVVVEEVMPTYSQDLLTRRGLKGWPKDKLKAVIDEATAPELNGILVELILCTGLGRHDAIRKQVAGWFDVDVEKIVREGLAVAKKAAAPVKLADRRKKR